jgi:hypothetical protein
MRTILATVGTSLLGNTRHDPQVEQPNAQQLANYLRHTDVILACAYTNSLSPLLQERDQVIFLSYERLIQSGGTA